jgi:hypothetical protein
MSIQTTTRYDNFESLEYAAKTMLTQGNHNLSTNVREKDIERILRGAQGRGKPLKNICENIEETYNDSAPISNLRDAARALEDWGMAEKVRVPGIFTPGDSTVQKQTYLLTDAESKENYAGVVGDRI